MGVARGVGVFILVMGLVHPLAMAQQASGRFVVVGNGEARAAPEFSRLTVTVSSICFDSSKSAKDTNAELAAQIVSLFRSFVNDEGHGQVTTRPGASVLQSETVWSGDQRRVVCERKWRFTNTITVELRDIEMLADVQDSLTRIIDSRYGLNPDLAAQTYGEIAAPSFHLTAETLQDLKVKAHKLAYEDARHQFDGLSEICRFQDTKLIRVAPPKYEMVAMHQGEALKVGEEPSDTPILPDELTVTSVLEFIWSFTRSDCD